MLVKKNASCFSGGTQTHDLQLSSSDILTTRSPNLPAVTLTQKKSLKYETLGDKYSAENPLILQKYNIRAIMSYYGGKTHPVWVTCHTKCQNTRQLSCIKMETSCNSKNRHGLKSTTNVFKVEQSSIPLS